MVAIASTARVNWHTALGRLMLRPVVRVLRVELNDVLDLAMDQDPGARAHGVQKHAHVVFRKPQVASPLFEDRQSLVVCRAGACADKPECVSLGLREPSQLSILARRFRCNETTHAWHRR